MRPVFFDVNPSPCEAGPAGAVVAAGVLPSYSFQSRDDVAALDLNDFLRPGDDANVALPAGLDRRWRSQFHASAIHAFVNVQRVAGLEPGAGDGGMDRLERPVGRAGILVVGGKVLLCNVVFAGGGGARYTPEYCRGKDEGLPHDRSPLDDFTNSVHY